MQFSTVINSTGFTISTEKDISVSGLFFGGNRQIKFLPTHIDENFPSLVAYYVGECSITSVSKDDFEGLSLLKALWLSGNEIEKINDDTFDEVKSLQWLGLSEKKTLR